MRFHVILNERSGTVSRLGLTAGELEKRFAAHGHEVHVETDISAGIETLVRKGLNSQPDAIVAAGGDGTVTATAGALKGQDVPLLIMPVGTANMLARDLGIPLELDEWFAAIGDFATKGIDVSYVNDQIFLHLVVVGMMPGIAAGREKVRDHASPSAYAGFLGFMAKRFARTRRQFFDIALDDRMLDAHRVSSVAVGNNIYDEGLGRFFSRQVLDEGLLSLYVLHRISVFDALRLAAGVFFGRWREDDALTIQKGKKVRLDCRRPRVKIMLDGEVMTMSTPLTFEIYHKALKVLAPHATEQTDAPPVVNEDTPVSA